ncbi:hypothetical protein EDD22DRAFT_848068 [Suillus occidentalis]|nr:hypothetical protein EDD22DRAFT_848068 [Suillus occidentalis]
MCKALHCTSALRRLEVYIPEVDEIYQDTKAAKYYFGIDDILKALDLVAHAIEEPGGIQFNLKLSYASTYQVGLKPYSTLRLSNCVKYQQVNSIPDIVNNYDIFQSLFFPEVPRLIGCSLKNLNLVLVWNRLQDSKYETVTSTKYETMPGKRGPKTWTTPDEETFLQDRLPVYIECRAQKCPTGWELTDLQGDELAQKILGLKKQTNVACLAHSSGSKGVLRLNTTLAGEMNSKGSALHRKNLKRSRQKLGNDTKKPQTSGIKPRSGGLRLGVDMLSSCRRHLGSEDDLENDTYNVSKECDPSSEDKLESDTSNMLKECNPSNGDESESVTYNALKNLECDPGPVSSLVTPPESANPESANKAIGSLWTTAPILAHNVLDNANHNIAL